MSYARISKYKSMWLFCLFDLPTKTKSQQKIAGAFRKALIDDGFEMMQFSVYEKFCPSLEAVETHINRIKKIIPQQGKVSFLKFTDKQYGDIKTFWGKVPQKPRECCHQLELF